MIRQLVLYCTLFKSAVLCCLCCRHNTVFKDVFREVGLLEVLVTCLSRYHELLKSRSPDTQVKGKFPTADPLRITRPQAPVLKARKLLLKSGSAVHPKSYCYLMHVWTLLGNHNTSHHTTRQRTLDRTYMLMVKSQFWLWWHTVITEEVKII